MRKRMLAIVLIFAMVSAFAMTSAVSAKEGFWQAGQSSIIQKRVDIAPGGVEYIEVGHGNMDTGHYVTHTQTMGQVQNTNTNNPNGPTPPV